MKRLPPWMKIRLVCNENSRLVQKTIAQERIHTVCESARCPNRHECFGRGTATIMILGDICTRDCRFCAVENGIPNAIDLDEPRRVSALAAKLQLRHVVVTSVTRDDISDGGSSVFKKTIVELKKRPGVTVEVLTPDFQGCKTSIATVLSACPDIFNHNVETVKRLQPIARPQADYERSLKVLKTASAWAPKIRVKSGLMAGLGETDDELYEAINDIFNAGCEYLTIGQYLTPTKKHLPVDRYVHPSLFEQYKTTALAIGFKMVESAPLVRSSYRAEKMVDNQP